MKQKNHSGLKKRLKIRKSGSVRVEKSCRRHLLINKTKRQKKLHKAGMPADGTRMNAIRKLLPGYVSLDKVRRGPKTNNAGGVKKETGEGAKKETEKEAKK